MTEQELQHISEELRELFRILDEQGWKPQLCDTPVPYYDNRVPCGKPLSAGDTTEGGYMMLPCDGADLDTTFMISVRGNSMIDAGIESGDRVEVLSTQTIDDGDIVLASIDGEFTVKALFIDDHDRYWLVPRNKDYDPILLSEESNAHIMGRVVSIRKGVRRAGHRDMRNQVMQSALYMPAHATSSAQTDGETAFTHDELRQAIAKAFAGTNPSSTDWIATYYVLTTYAKAPTSYSAFAEWVNALGVEGMPSCKADLLRKADGVYLQPLYRWEDNTTVRESTLQRRLSIAKVLRGELKR